jgi:hypothetical protein
MYQVLWSGAALRENRHALSQREPVLIRGQVKADRQGQIIVAGRSVARLTTKDESHPADARGTM